MADSWIWPADNGGVHGASIDAEKRLISWYDDAAGCACSGSIAEQTYEQFEVRGPVLGTVPDDVMAEMRSQLSIPD